MEYDLYAIMGVVKELYATDLVEDGIILVIDHVVGDNRRQSVPLHSEEAAAEDNAIRACNELLLIGHGVAVVPFE